MSFACTMMVRTLFVALLSVAPAHMATAENFYPLTKAKLKKAQNLALYCEKIFGEDFEFGSALSAQAYANEKKGKYFTGERTLLGTPIDAAFLFEENNQCVVTFQSTKPNIPDWLQNFDLMIATEESKADPLKKCNVRGGFYKAYKSLSEELEDEVDDCMKRNSELIFNGHSQGGAIAMVAGVAFEMYNPLIVTFGQPPVFVSNCELVPDDNIWRFINTENDKGLYPSLALFDDHMDYDPAPFVEEIIDTFFLPRLAASSSFGSKVLKTAGIFEEFVDTLVQVSKEKFDRRLGHHQGPVIFLPPGDTNGEGCKGKRAKYYSKWGEVPDINFGDGYFDIMDGDFLKGLSGGGISNSVVSAHSISNYKKKLLYLHDSGSDPVNVNGFGAWSFCNFHVECGRTCVWSHHLCSDGKNGQLCESNSDCDSSRCDHDLKNVYGYCKAKLGRYELCNDDSDCISNYCNWLGICSVSDGELGKFCTASGDCKSGHCDWSNWAAMTVCKTKLSYGEYCNEDSDCKSNYCNRYSYCS